jgi:exosome complex exonuclease DIS3/RRP44
MFYKSIKFRYADICVHRLLAAAIGVEPLPLHFSSKSHLHDLCDIMNRRHRAAQLAGRASVQLHTLIYFAGEGGATEVDAYILHIDAASNAVPKLNVMVPRFGIEGNVSIPIDQDDPSVVWRSELHQLTYKARTTESTVTLKVFDKVTVKISVRQTPGDGKELVMDLATSTITMRKDEALRIEQVAPSLRVTTKRLAPDEEGILSSQVPRKKVASVF